MLRPAYFATFSGLALLTATTFVERRTSAQETVAPAQAERLPRIRPSKDQSHFVREGTNERVAIWGFNYDHDDAGRLLEDYWSEKWATVVEDFHEMKALGAQRRESSPSSLLGCDRRMMSAGFQAAERLCQEHPFPKPNSGDSP